MSCWVQSLPEMWWMISLTHLLLNLCCHSYTFWWSRCGGRRVNHLLHQGQRSEGTPLGVVDRNVCSSTIVWSTHSLPDPWPCWSDSDLPWWVRQSMCLDDGTMYIAASLIPRPLPQEGKAWFMLFVHARNYPGFCGTAFTCFTYCAMSLGSPWLGWGKTKKSGI